MWSSEVGCAHATGMGVGLAEVSSASRSPTSDLKYFCGVSVGSRPVTLGWDQELHATRSFGSAFSGCGAATQGQ